MNNYGPSWTNCGGASSAANANEAAQTAFYTQMTEEQSTTFAEQQELYQNLLSVWQPIFDAGPNQLGFSPAENDALRSEIISSSGEATAQSEDATKMALEQGGGGKSDLTTGAEAQLESASQVLGGQAQAESLQQEQLEDYQQGLQDFENASTALTGEQQIVNPIGTADAANGAGQNATSAIKLVDSENTSILGSILGGISGGLSSATSIASL